MKLFFDEDTGVKVPKALRLVGFSVSWVGSRSGAGVGKGTQDEDWIPVVGRKNWLLFSCNKGILQAEAQKNLLISHKVGAVFLTTGQERSPDILYLILRKRKWLEKIDAEVERPFAFMITITGRIKQIDLGT